MTDHTHTNDLIHETSPYLLQHAHNPVNWMPWGEKAWGKAKAENKLVIVSIGYSACHWCHVMEHESFEDSVVARIMNDHFVSIKVDREERPDVDQIYMDAVQIISGHGGWPLNAICLPDGRPIYAGTYFRNDQWKQVLLFLVDEYTNRKDESLKRAEEITEGIKSLDTIPFVGDSTFSKTALDTIWNKYEQTWDFRYGGRSGAPKFPMPSNLNYLLELYHANKNPKTLEALTVTLDKMLEGGIYDHAGGGFARYSVDEYWHIPHFEKMLYDNAQLMEVYASAYSLTKKPAYKTAVYKTLEFLDRELKDKSGVYYSALDADSEGEEGKFYVWTNNDLKQLLGNDYATFAERFDVSDHGNFEEANHLVRKTLDGFGSEQEQRWMNLLLQERSKRIRPGLDDKSLTSWNALLLKSLATCFTVFHDNIFLNHAKNLEAFIPQNVLHKDGQLFRNYKNGKVSIPAFLEDYALLASAYVQLYKATWNESYLHQAKALTDYSVQHFYNAKNGMFYFTSVNDEPLIARKTETSDNVIPSSNAVMANVLFQLGEIMEDSHYQKTALQMMKNMQQMTEQYTNFYSLWGSLELKYMSLPYEVVIVGEKALQLKKEFEQNYLPNVLLMGTVNEGIGLPLMKDKFKQGETLIYICKDKTCGLPVKTVKEAVSLIH